MIACPRNTLKLKCVNRLGPTRFAWVRKSHRCSGARCRHRYSARGCTWGSQAVSRAAGAHFMRRVGTSAIWSLSDEKRTSRGHFETVAQATSAGTSMLQWRGWFQSLSEGQFGAGTMAYCRAPASTPNFTSGARQRKSENKPFPGSWRERNAAKEETRCPSRSV